MSVYVGQKPYCDLRLILSNEILVSFITLNQHAIYRYLAAPGEVYAIGKPSTAGHELWLNTYLKYAGNLNTDAW